MKRATRTKYTILTAVICSLAAIEPAIAAPTPAEVGDADSFGHPALYMGAASGSVTLSAACTPAPAPANDSQCFNLEPAPAQTTFDGQDICRLKLPKKATRTIIYPALNFFVNYQLQNTTGAFQPQGVFSFIATLTIESDALVDPSIIDPNTGLPANGKLVNQFAYTYRDDRSMDVNDRQRLRETLVRVGNTGITKGQLIGQGLSPAVVDALFNGPMTIRMSISGTAKLVTDASVTGNMRLFGD